MTSGTTTAAGPGAPSRARRVLLLPGVGLLLVAAVTANIGVGAVTITPAEVAAILGARLGLPVEVDVRASQVLLAIRVPRVLVAILVGGALAVAGAGLQGVFRNPLADPGIIGTASGAALGAVGAIWLGVPGRLGIPAAAFAGALVATVAVYASARFQGRTEVVTLVLTGIAINAIAGAGIGMIRYLADDDQLRSITFWGLGSVAGGRWADLAVLGPVVLTGVLLAPRWARALDLFSLGEAEAEHLGVDTERTRLGVIAASALLTGAAVSVAGVIGFVGLVVPHLIRLTVGPGHRLLLPASALGGASLLLLADLAARTVAAPAELPLGVLTALVGGPFFLWLLQRTRRGQGGWG